MTLSSSGMSADLSRPAACRAGPECQPHLPIPTLLRSVSSLTGLPRLPCLEAGGSLASFWLLFPAFMEAGPGLQKSQFRSSIG